MVSVEPMVEPMIATSSVSVLKSSVLVPILLVPPLPEGMLEASHDARRPRLIAGASSGLVVLAS